MAEEQREIQSINWKKVFGFLEIMRSFRMAIHPAKIVLCLLGLGAMFGLGLALDQISGFATAEGEESFCYNVTTLYETLIAYDVDLDMGVVASIEQLAMRPVVVAGDSIELAMEYWGNHFWFALIYSVISLAIWALIGGAVTRMAAVQVAREESIPLKEALCFATRKWPSLVTAPLIPFIVLIAMGLLITLASLPINVPYVEIIGSVLFILALLAGLILALIFVGGVFSVGLQWPTIAAEGSDSFDAISRSVSYISSRPWRYLFYTGFSVVYGCLSFIFVQFIVYLALRLTHCFAALGTWGYSGGEVELADKVDRIWTAPEMGYLWTWPDVDSMARGSETIAAGIISVWVLLLIGAMVAFLISFCLSSQTVIYFLLRRLVDSTDIDEVYLEEEEEEEVAEHAVEEPEAEEAKEEKAKKEEAEEQPPEEEKKEE